MPRAIVTSSLAETLRNIRIQNKIQANKLASHISKSPAYISKLESGNIQSIDTKELDDILKFISGNESSIKLAEQIYKTLTLKYSPKEIEEELWFVNYDTVHCLLPIPDSLIDSFNSRIDSLGITRHYLIERINANEALTDEEKSDSSIPLNQWYRSKRHSEFATSIKIFLSEDKFNKILNKEKDVAPYVFIFCILYYLLKIERHHDNILISQEQNNELMQDTTTILNQYKFLSIQEKHKIALEKQTKNEVFDALNSFDKDNIDLVNKIVLSFQFASEQNIKTTNEQLKSFCDNMHWDLGFMLRVISINYSCLMETNFSNRKKLLAEIEELIEKYRNLPEEDNRIEMY